jgi:hypothetical protein
MALYLVEHQHSAETCPTKSADMMLMLGKHVTQMTADQFGIKIQADVVHPGEHRLLMVRGGLAGTVDEYEAVRHGRNSGGEAHEELRRGHRNRHLLIRRAPVM